jgi:hypothetical protein
MDPTAYGLPQAAHGHGFSVLARAAVNGEVDPLTDVDVRLFVGLMPLG